jgi:carbamoyltransferase
VRIIGVHNDEDAGVCLLQDGELVEAVNEERFNRTKLYQGLPTKALRYVLEKRNLSLQDIDYFAYGWHGRRNDFGDYAKRLAARVLAAARSNPSDEVERVVDERISSEFARDAATRDEFEAWMLDLEVPSPKVAFLDHHQSHAWSAFACSPFDQALVFTMDGRGDLKSASVSEGRADVGLVERYYELSFDSLGFLYGQITHHLGFRPHRHEGKVTGLAAYGDPAKTRPIFEKLVSWKDGGIRTNLGVYRPFYTRMDEAISERLRQHSREDVAAGLQAHCEDLVGRFVTEWHRRTGKTEPIPVCLAGGLFANVRINQVVAELPCVDGIFVFPHMGDGGLTVGAACNLQFQLSGRSKIELPTVLLGPEYDDEAIGIAIEAYADHVEATRCDNVVDATVADLCANRVVGFFQGRMEFGPRALGARSILHHCRDRDANTWLNERLHRTEFMPFAPVTPIAFAEECYVGWTPADRCSRFMTKTFDCTAVFTERHPAVVHIDGTARPQIVSPEANGIYHDVVKAYCDRTGERALINTSFNQHEEPIVCSPSDAIGSLIAANVDVLYLGSWRVESRSS